MDRDERDASREDSERDHKWRVKREISTGDMLLALSMIVGLFLWGSSIDKRITTIEERQAMQTRVDAAQDQTTRDALNLIYGELRDIKQYLLNNPRQASAASSR